MQLMDDIYFFTQVQLCIRLLKTRSFLMRLRGDFLSKLNLNERLQLHIFISDVYENEYSALFCKL